MAMKIIARKDAKRVGLKRYFTGKPCREGHVAERQVCTGHCVVCNLARVNAEYKKPKVRKRKKIYNKLHYWENKEEINQQCREYHAAHRKERSLQRKQRRSEIREWEGPYLANRRATDKSFDIGCKTRQLINSAIKRNSFNSSAVDIIGCSVQFMRDYIETQFVSGMSWKNHGKKWVFDHIKPIGSFDLTKHRQLLEAFHYSNTRPLTISAHEAKSAKEKNLRRK